MKLFEFNIVRFLLPSINKNNKPDRKNTNISLTEALISIGPRKLKLVQKITFKRNLRQIFRTRVGIPELDKKNKTNKENRRI
jgi:hypothetical protein